MSTEKYIEEVEQYLDQPDTYQAPASDCAKLLALVREMHFTLMIVACGAKLDCNTCESSDVIVRDSLAKCDQIATGSSNGN